MPNTVTIGAFEAKTHFSELINEVQNNKRRRKKRRRNGTRSRKKMWMPGGQKRIMKRIMGTRKS
jgi:hypothetical protein